MKKIVVWITAIMWLFSLFSIQGCLRKIPLKVNNPASLAPLKVGYYGEPKPRMVAHNNGLETAGLFTLILIPVGLALTMAAGTWKHIMEQEIESANMPDIRELVARKFVERAPKEILNWPGMDLEEELIDEKYIKTHFEKKSGNLMVVKISQRFPSQNNYQITTGGGLFVMIDSTIRDFQGNLYGEGKFITIQKILSETLTWMYLRLIILNF